jgi:hypothetical protein
MAQEPKYSVIQKLIGLTFLVSIAAVYIGSVVVTENKTAAFRNTGIWMAIWGVCSLVIQILVRSTRRQKAPPKDE